MRRIAILSSKCGELCLDLMRAFRERGCEAPFVPVQEVRAAAGHALGLHKEPNMVNVSKIEEETGRQAGAKKCPGNQISVSESEGSRVGIIEEFDAAVIRGIPAGSLEQVIFRMDALYERERAGLPIINSPKAIEKTVDKYYTTALLEEGGLSVPPTICVQGDTESAVEAFYELGEDVIYKPLFGSCGSGLRRFKTEREVREAAPALLNEGRVLYLQKYIPCGGRDIRAFVLGGEVIASMERRGRDWRANLTLGGTAVPRELSAAEKDMAIRAAAAVGAEVAGVDLLCDEDGQLYVIEVNGCPGWKGLASVTGVDVAAALAEYVIRTAEGR